ncbi:MAG: zf-HC2 domain-containing protein [Planctomycetota bacterium]
MRATLSAVKKILTLPCSEASLLMSDSMDRKLSLAERLALRGHFLACKSCPPALREMHLVRKATRALSPAPADASVQAAESVPEHHLSETARQRIRQSLRDTTAE